MKVETDYAEYVVRIRKAYKPDLDELDILVSDLEFNARMIQRLVDWDRESQP